MTVVQLRLSIHELHGLLLIYMKQFPLALLYIKLQVISNGVGGLQIVSLILRTYAQVWYHSRYTYSMERRRVHESEFLQTNCNHVTEL